MGAQSSQVGAQRGPKGAKMEPKGRQKGPDPDSVALKIQTRTRPGSGKAERGPQTPCSMMYLTTESISNRESEIFSEIFFYGVSEISAISLVPIPQENKNSHSKALCF